MCIRDRFKTPEFTRGLVSVGNALLDIFAVIGNIGVWVARNFHWIYRQSLFGYNSLKWDRRIEPEPPPDEKYCVRIREYQFMKQPGVRAGKSERNSKMCIRDRYYL